jgi:MFS family permease
VTTVAFCSEHGHRSFAGVVLGLWAFGSMLAGLVTGAIHHTRSTTTRVRLGAFGLAITTVPLVFIGTLPLLCVFMMLAGLAISPTVVAAMSLTEEVVPTSRMTEGIAIMFTAMTLGEAPAAALAGVIIDHSGASPAYFVLVGATAVAAVLSLLLPRVRAGGPDSPAVPQHAAH